MAEQENRNANGHWWKNYVVRYFVGTVVGAGIVVLLNEYPGSPFKGLLSSVQELKDATFRDVTIFASVGLAFCYIASAPVLTLHGTRDHLRLSQLRRSWILWIVIPLVITAAIWYFLAYSQTNQPISQRGAVVLGIIVSVQVVLVLAALIDRLSSVSSFYWRLSAARANSARQIIEYVESYRHLREHGNAFSILLVEMALGFILVSLPNQISAVPVLVIWMLPASTCWLLGTVLESKLAYAPQV
jgi:hypothetical protein